MTFEWGFQKLGDLTINLDAKRKPVKEVDRKRGPYPYYGASGIVDYVDGYLFEGEHLLIAEDGENLRTRQTPIAFRADGKFWVNNHAHIVIGNHRASTRYLEYAVLGTDISAYLTGAVMPKLTQGNLNRIEVPCPPIEAQKSIVAVLGGLDDRLTLLRETNATLEAIAQALFKSWFVDFDPVRAKSEGKLPKGMDEATAALFPDVFVETELGMAPKGWSIGKLSDFVTLRNERLKPSSEVKQLPYVPIECISTRNPFLTDFKSGEEANSSLTLFKEGDILFGAMRPYFHKVCVAPFDGVTRTTVFPLKANSEKERGFALFFVYQSTTIDFATQNSEGSTIPYAKWKGSLELMQCLIPSKDLREEFSKLVDSFIDKANVNVANIKTLSNLRDSLLPRLISGQLRITDAEAELEKVTA